MRLTTEGEGYLINKNFKIPLLFIKVIQEMRTITLPIPDSFNLNEMELKIILAGELYEREKLSLGQAAALAGLTKRNFIEIMGKYGFSLFSTAEEDIISDIKNA